MLCAIISHKSYSQYTLRELAKKTIVKTKIPTMLPNTKKQGDTTITTYIGGSTEILLYFVEGEQYDEIFNPNPSGLYLNKQHFTFYCDPDKTSKQSVTKIANIYEFTFLGRNYLCTITLREQNIESKYKCYNFFDITDINKITQGSFPSIYVGEDSFGDFNGDNALDCITVINRKPETFTGKMVENAYTLRAYTFEPSNLKLSQNDSTESPYFIYALFDDEKMSNFKVLQADWFFPLQDSTGKILEKVTYVTKWTSTFDPKDKIIENYQIPINKYSVVVGRFDTIEGVESLIEEIKSKQTEIKRDEFIIKMEQHGSEIKWVLLVGNHATKKEVQKVFKELQKLGYQPEIVDLRRKY
jgi:hypothetical protein